MKTRSRFDASIAGRLMALAWRDRDHQRLRTALDDLCAPDAEGVLG